MIHGICEYAQRTSSLRMCNTLHENDACILHIYTYPHLFEIFFKMPERNSTTPNSTQSMNATMKVNGKLWTLALGFKEGLSLGDRTSAQSTLLTWGVNSVWSNLNSWREEWRQHQTLYKSLQVNSSIYMAFEMTSRPISVVQSTSIAALRPDSIGRCTKEGPRWSCEDSGECRIFAARVNESRSFVSESDCFQQDTATAADFDCAFALPEAWSSKISKICTWSNSAVGAISGLMVWPSCFTCPWSNRYENANICARTNLDSVLRGAELKEHVSHLGSFLAQICFDHGDDTLSANLLELPSNHFVCFKCLESSCCFLAHPGSSLGRLKSSLGRHVQVTNLPAC